MDLLPENSSQNNAIFAQSLFTLMKDHFAMLKFLWLCNHHSIYICISIIICNVCCHYARITSIA